MKPSTKTFDLPEHPGEYITVPRKLGSARKMEINSKLNPGLESRGVDAQGRPITVPIIDLNRGALEAVIQAATHPEANWNLKDENGKPLSRDPETIKRNPEYEDDFIAVSPGIFAFVMGLPEDASAEGNASVSGSDSPPPPDGESNSKNSTKGQERRK